MSLQDSTRYEKTAKLLERFDPDYVPPTPRKQQQQHALRTAFIPPTPRAPGVPTPVRSTAGKPKLLALSSLTMMPMPHPSWHDT